MRSYITAIATFFLFLGCNGKSEIPNFEMKPINLDLSSKGKFSDFFESIEYILLDTPDESPIVEIHNTKFLGGRIFLQDYVTSQLFIFDDKGRFEKVISPMGKGPGEYFQMSDFHVMNDTVYILDCFLNKLLQFDLSGEFVQESSHYLNNNNFYVGTEYKLLFNSFNPEYGRYNFLRLNGQGLDGFVEFEREKENIVNYSSHTGFIDDPHRDYIYFNIPYSTDVAIFNKKHGDLSQAIRFDFGKYNTEIRILKERYAIQRELQSQHNLVLGLSAFFPFKDQYILVVNQGGNKFHYLLLDQNFQPIEQFVDLKNDIDDIEFVKYPWSFSDYELVFSVSTIDFYNDYVSTFKNKKVNVNDKNVHGFFNKHKERLIEDNQMLIKLKVKSLVG